MITDAADGSFERVDLIEAALVAGGTFDPREIARLKVIVERQTSQLKPRIKRLREPEARAEALLMALHKHVFTGRYIAAQSDIAATLDRGDYNCLSSVILYVAMARSLGIDVQPAVLPGHIVAILPGANGPKPVETTCAEWFSLVRTGGESSVRVPSMAGGEPYDRRTAKPLTDPELIALVYYNQGYEHLTHNRFAEAWSANQKALALDAHSSRSRGNALATINNWSLALCERGEFSEARQLVAKGLRMAPDYAPLLANNRHLHRLWAEKLSAAGHWQAAAEVLEQAALDWPNEPYFANLLRRLNQRSALAAA